jgi:hypothetical protein
MKTIQWMKVECLKGEVNNQLNAKLCQWMTLKSISFHLLQYKLADASAEINTSFYSSKTKRSSPIHQV